ncbi:endogenous retrovirus group K member 7 Gag polyprotein-like [Oryx dammah]|uniref:endogenous retrovirus group K member 7 Gag polyprotein-like n=1 Tax=Oryx dammah TaxID=59534 RepID=UPI001A9AF8D1|nr:endogenous retrovirus group K member 7 Gag polyprotein-like [Oryx dammah]
MGQTHSRQLFVHMLFVMLKHRGITVSRPKLTNFLSFIEEVCPWFPREGTVNLETWKKVGEQIKTHYTLHGPDKVPIETLSLWTLIRDCLDFDNEELKRLGKLLKEEDKAANEPEYAVPEGLEGKPQPLKSPQSLDVNDVLSSEDADELEEEAAKYHHEDWEFLAQEEKHKASDDDLMECVKKLAKLLCISDHKFNLSDLSASAPPLPPAYAPSVVAGLDPPPGPVAPSSSQDTISPLQKALRQAQRLGETVSDFALAFPVFEQNNQRFYEALPFKQLKELKVACSQYGPTAPFTMAMIKNLGTQNLPPNDWKQIARACLLGGDYLLWKSEYIKQCGRIADVNRQQGIQTSYEMLIGDGAYQATNAQLNFLPGAYAQISNAARQAWKKLPSSSTRTEDLSKIRQGPEEPYQDFVARLLDAIGKIMSDEHAGIILAKQLAFENANSACQAALRPYRKKGDLSDFIRICADIGPSYMQGIAMAAALQGKSIKEVLFQQQARNKRGTQRVNNNSGCFVCGQPGHRAVVCPQKYQATTNTPNLCPRCKKGKHWAKDCRSKTDVQGNPLPPLSGNWVRGQPQAPKQCYGATVQVPSEQSPICTEPRKGVPDWTSVPPPTQY